MPYLYKDEVQCGLLIITLKNKYMSFIRKVRIGNTSIFIPRNENNSAGGFWNPIGMFNNIPTVEKNGKWYSCGVSFIEKDGTIHIRIHDLIMHEDNSNTIKEHISGTYKEMEVSKFKMNLIRLLMNDHNLNYRWHGIRKSIYRRRYTIFVFSSAVALSTVYYLGNERYNDALGQFIANNTWMQALFILLNIFTLGSVFFPFTIRKELSEADVKQILTEEIIKYEDEKEKNEIARRRATF